MSSPLVQPASHVDDALLLRMATIAVDAANAITAACSLHMGSTTKGDGSLVTDADHAADRAIRSGLGAAFPDIPVVSEEDAEPRGDTPTRFFLVDPLDGTRDFVSGSTDYTVNIALIQEGRATAGVIVAPARGRLFVGGGQMAFAAAIPPCEPFDPALPRQPLQTRVAIVDKLVALESCSSTDRQTETWVGAIAPGERRQVGSSLKFAVIAAGEADLYVRGISLCEWDIAAGDAILTAAGGIVCDLAGAPLRYGAGGCEMRAPPFLAIGDRRLAPALIRAVTAARPG